MDNKRQSICNNISAIRRIKGYSQEYVASKIGIKQSGYGLLENGKRSLSYDQLLLLAIVFEMDVVDIITYPDKLVMPNNLEKKSLKTENLSSAIEKSNMYLLISLAEDECLDLRQMKENVIRVLSK